MFLKTKHGKVHKRWFSHLDVYTAVQKFYSILLLFKIKAFIFTTTKKKKEEEEEEEQMLRHYSHSNRENMIFCQYFELSCDIKMVTELVQTGGLDHV